MDYTVQGVNLQYSTPSRLYCFLEDIGGATMGSLDMWSNDLTYN